MSGYVSFILLTHVPIFLLWWLNMHSNIAKGLHLFASEESTAEMMNSQLDVKEKRAMSIEICFDSRVVRRPRVEQRSWKIYLILKVFFKVKYIIVWHSTMHLLNTEVGAISYVIYWKYLCIAHLVGLLTNTRIQPCYKLLQLQSNMHADACLQPCYWGLYNSSTATRQSWEAKGSCFLQHLENEALQHSQHSLCNPNLCASRDPFSSILLLIFSCLIQAAAWLN